MSNAIAKNNGIELVLFHGWGASRQVWQPLISLLTTQAETIGIKLQCHNLSLPGYDGLPALKQANALDELTQTLLVQLPEKAHWLGWSLGGNVALHIAEQAPERVQQMILLASNPCFAQREDWSLGMPQDMLSQFQADFAQQPNKTLSRFQSLQAQGETDFRGIKKQFATLNNTAPAADLSSLAAGLSWLAELDQRQPSAAIVDKLHWILAEHDALVPATVAENVQGKAYVLENCAHLVLLSQTEQLAQTVLTILQQEVSA